MNTKIKQIIYFILKLLRDIFIAIFGFLFAFFTKNSPKKTTTNHKLPSNSTNLTKESKENLDLSEFNTTNPIKITLTKETQSFKDDNLTDLIKFYFLKYLELKEQELTKKDIEYLNDLTIKISPIINNISNSKDNISNLIEELIEKELKEQLKIEQELTIEKQVITPIILRKTDPKVPSSTAKEQLHPKDLTKQIPIHSFNANLKIQENISLINKEEPTVNEPKITSLNNITPNTENILKDPYLEPNILTKPNDMEIPLKHQTLNSNQNLNIKQKELKKSEEPTKHPENFHIIDFKNLDTVIKSVITNFQEETTKEELIDKNYQELEEHIHNLLIEINKLKLQNLSPHDLEELNLKEKQVLNFQEKLINQKEKDISNEINTLEEPIFKEDLHLLELEFKKLHIENTLDFQEKLLNNLEELELMSTKKAKQLEKELLKRKLKRAINAMNIANFPMFRNKFFRFFTMNLFTNQELKEFHAILKRKTLNFNPPLLIDIKKGFDALEEASLLSQENISYLNFLELEAFKKYPELTLDSKYLSYLHILKMQLLNNQEKLQKKEKVITKYKLKIQKRIRKLKKNAKHKPNIPNY